ncbi:MAG: two-component system response regulator [Gammaproteobacteria bacterium]|nr:MAG: two-component system response regulator [Gammaproteobacteria bacterium]
MKSGIDTKILIVDDVSENIQVAMNILKEESYTFSFACDGEEALALIKKEYFDLILLDIMMPKLDGYEVCKQIKLIPEVQDIPVIFLTAKNDVDAISKGFEVGGIDYIIKPFHACELLARIKTHLELAYSKKLLKQKNTELALKAELQGERLLKEVEENQREMIYVLMEVMESTSDETGKHIKRVAESSKLLAHYTSYLTEEDEDIIFHAAPMHDIGKIAIPKEILHKPGKLTPEELDIMKTHAEKGRDFLKNSKRKLLTAAAIIAYEHHEKWDGTGYPQGLKGNNIHIYGRIIALADVFDALTHKRQYKHAWAIDDAVEYIKSLSGKQFDPDLVAIFSEHLPEFIAIIND